MKIFTRSRLVLYEKKLPTDRRGKNKCQTRHDDIDFHIFIFKHNNTKEA